MIRRDGWNGSKRKYIKVDSGVEHNPAPRTERGKRRRAAKYPNGIPEGHPAHSGK
jgi:hypothetical protein